MISIQSQEFARRLHTRGLPLGNWLGAAGWGVVYQSAANPRRVFKVTQMLREAEAALWVRQQQRGFNEPAHHCLPIIYGWEQDQDAELKHPKGSHANFWIIEREELPDLRLNSLVNIPLARSTRENLIFDRIADAIFQGVETATMMSQAVDVERLAYALMKQTLMQLEVREWEAVETQVDAELAERLGEIIKATHRHLGRQMHRLAEFAAYCVRHDRVLGDVNHWNWGVRSNGEIVVRDLGGFLARQYRHGPFEGLGLGAWDPKVIKGGASRPVTKWRKNWRDGRPLLPKIGFSVRFDLVPSKDPWAYSNGFIAAMHGDKPDESRIGSEWAKGFAHGIRVRGGQEDLPKWLELPSAAKKHVPVGKDTGIERIFRLFARPTSRLVAVKSGSVSISSDGKSLYSYGKLIAQKRMQDQYDNVCYVEKRKRSKTTAKHINMAKRALYEAGWKTIEVEFP